MRRPGSYLKPLPKYQQKKTVKILALVLLLSGFITFLFTPKILAQDKFSTIYIIPIKGPVERGLSHFIQRGINEAQAAKADLILFNIDTLGGKVDAAVEIRDLLLECPIETATFINHKAISAGALIAIATKRIIVARSATIGAATPIMMSPTGETHPTGEKVVSYVRAEFRDTAERNNYPVKIVEAMVDPDVEIDDLCPKGKLLTLTSEQAIKYAIAQDEADNIREAIKKLGFNKFTTITIEESWAEKIARFFTHPVVSGLLMMAGILGFYLEFKTPGISLPGLMGTLCFILFFWGHSIAGLAGWEHFIFFLLGLILLFIELFITPGFGLLGISGIICILLSLIFSLTQHSPFSPLFNINDLVMPLLLLMSVMITSSVTIAILAIILPHTTLLNRLVLSGTETGFDSINQTSEELIGLTGVTETMLRPTGMANFGDKRLDVVSEGDYLPVGVKVTIVAVEGRRVIVRPV